jgi:uncharacterized membrane protein YqjE
MTTGGGIMGFVDYINPTKNNDKILLGASIVTFASTIVVIIILIVAMSGSSDYKGMFISMCVFVVLGMIGNVVILNKPITRTSGGYLY